MQWYMVPWKKYAEFTGRAGRAEYWTFSLINIVILVVLLVIAAVSASTSHDPFGPAMVVYAAFALAELIPALAVAVRRLHDTNKSGWWLLIGLIPIVGGIVLLVFFLLDGTQGPNQFGPGPYSLGPPAPYAGQGPYSGPGSYTGQGPYTQA
jgi:uncharacterized membrane protein YhaH (DUF805 family)